MFFEFLALCHPELVEGPPQSSSLVAIRFVCYLA
jgi:hypothetical protein